MADDKLANTLDAESVNGGIHGKFDNHLHPSLVNRNYPRWQQLSIGYRMRVAYLAGVGGFVLFVSGCAGIADIDRMNQFESSYSRGDYRGAAAVLGGKQGLDYDEENLLTSLHVGAALRAAGSFDTSQTAFDRAEEQLYWTADEISNVDDFVKESLSYFAGSDLISSYHGNIYDGVLVNTYKAMNALSLEDENRAQVELNRADQRQENAVIQLKAKKKALAESSTDEEAAHQEDVDGLMTDPKIAKALNAVKGHHKYKDLRNPFTDWLHGVFRLATGEPNKASDYLRKAFWLSDKNSYVMEDVRIAEVAAENAIPAQSRVWIVHEDGIGPRLNEVRYDLPIPMSDGIIYAGIAFPEFVGGTPGARSLIVEADQKIYRTEQILNIDGYAATEFDIGYDKVIGKAVASAFLKVIAQVAVHKEADEMENPLLGVLLKIGSSVTAAATTNADTRIWRALPKSINIASIPWPKDGRIRISPGSGGAIRDIQLPSAEFVIVMVKTIHSGAQPVVHVASLGKKFAANQVSGFPIQPVVELGDTPDTPSFRLAVMDSDSQPERVDAVNFDSTSNEDISGKIWKNADEEKSGFGYSLTTTKFSSESSNWWRQHVSLDETLKKEGLRKLAFTRSVNAGGLVRVAGEFFNSSQSKFSAMYRFVWLDDFGQPIDSILSSWEVVHALPGTLARFHGTAPRDDINDFYLELTSISRALSEDSSGHDHQNTH